MPDELLKTCKHCQSRINMAASRCPQCGGDLRAWPARHPVLTLLLIVFVGFPVLGGILSGLDGTSSDDSKKTRTVKETVTKTITKTVGEVTKTVTQVQTVQLPPPAPAVAFGDGTFIVGTDIQPGTYRSTKEGCYWARLGGFGGSLDEIIANDHSTIVTITPTDTGFKSSGCGSWSLVQ